MLDKSVADMVLSKLHLSTSSTDIENAIEEIEVKIHNFCNIPMDEELPAQLKYVHANMVVDLYNYDNQDADISSVPVKSVTMGDVSYSFATENQKIDDLILNYKQDLLAFRRLKK